MTRAYLALGSNVGDRAAQLAAAAAALAGRGVRVLRSSSAIETEPFGVVDQPRFLNQVLEVEWTGTARELLDAAKAAEAEVGRRPTYRWGPREIDVDVLVLGDQVVDEPELRVPHPGIAEREFVLRPLAELAPELRVPGIGRTVRDLLASILGG